MRIVFEKGTIGRLSELIDPSLKVMMTYGGGSNKKKVVEFSGIEPNPSYETCMQAVERFRAERVDFLCR